MTSIKKIRKGVFETNSSSTHSICVAKEMELTIPSTIHFEFGSFGWQYDTLQSVYEKASYLYTGLYDNERYGDFTKIVRVLTQKGIEVSFDEPTWKSGECKKENGETVQYSYPNYDGYVDHADQLNDFLDDLCEDESKLLSYLFSDLSFIITGNDNDDHDVDIEVDYPHDEYYKSN